MKAAKGEAGEAGKAGKAGQEGQEVVCLWNKLGTKQQLEADLSLHDHLLSALVLAAVLVLLPPCRRIASFGFSTSSYLIFIFCAFFFFPIYASPHLASLTSS